MADWRVAVVEALLRWGPSNFQSFPWRENDVPAWQALLAEVFLQRTRAAQAASVFAKVQSCYPTIESLRLASDDELREMLRPLGLHWRSPLIISLARHLADVEGDILRTSEALQSLPGVGPYAAAATLSLHLDTRAVLIDSNIVRVLARLTGRSFGPETRRERWMRNLAESLTPKSEHRTYNYALLDLAMTVCTPRVPHCDRCPLVALCCLGKKRVT